MLKVFKEDRVSSNLSVLYGCFISLHEYEYIHRNFSRSINSEQSCKEIEEENVL